MAAGVPAEPGGLECEIYVHTSYMACRVGGEGLWRVGYTSGQAVKTCPCDSSKKRREKARLIGLRKVVVLQSGWRAAPLRPQHSTYIRMELDEQHCKVASLPTSPPPSSRSLVAFKYRMAHQSAGRTFFTCTARGHPSTRLCFFSFLGWTRPYILPLAVNHTNDARKHSLNILQD